MSGNQSTSQTYPPPTEINLPGGFSRSELSAEFHEWQAYRDHRVTLGDLIPSETVGQLTTSKGQTGILSNSPIGTQSHWSINDPEFQVAGGHYHVKWTHVDHPKNTNLTRINYCLINGQGFEVIEDENATLDGYIRRIEEVDPATIHEDGTYIPSVYSACPWTIEEDQDLFTYNHGREGGSLGQRQGEMYMYTCGSRRGLVQAVSAMGRGVNHHGRKNKVKVEWDFFVLGDQAVTRFRTQGRPGTEFLVPTDATGEENQTGKVNSCNGFFRPGP